MHDAVTTDTAQPAVDTTTGPASLDQALAIAEAGGSVREAAARLRQRLAPLKVVVVDAMDLRDETPFAQGPRHRLYLGATDGHCWSVTADPARASALFIAELG